MFWERFLSLCTENDTKPNAVAKQLGFSSAVCTQWKQRGTTPKIEYLSKIADYFGVSVDYLAGNSPYKMPPEPKTDPNAAYKMPDSSTEHGGGDNEKKPRPAIIQNGSDLVKRFESVSTEELQRLSKFVDIMNTDDEADKKELDTFMDFLIYRKNKDRP